MKAIIIVMNYTHFSNQNLVIEITLNSVAFSPVNTRHCSSAGLMLKPTLDTSLVFTGSQWLRGYNSISRGGGEKFLSRANYLFQPGSAAALKISHCITCLYRTVLEVNYYFMQSPPEIIYLKKLHPRPLKIEWWLPYLQDKWIALSQIELAISHHAFCQSTVRG